MLTIIDGWILTDKIMVHYRENERFVFSEVFGVEADNLNSWLSWACSTANELKWERERLLPPYLQVSKHK